MTYSNNIRPVSFVADAGTVKESPPMTRWIVGVLVTAQALAVAPAFASTRGRLNTAGLLTGVAVYAWMQHARHPSAGRRNTALLTTAGAAYAWYSYNKSKKAERNRERQRAAYYRALAYRNGRQARYYRSRYSRARYAHRGYARTRYGYARTRYARR